MPAMAFRRVPPILGLPYGTVNGTPCQGVSPPFTSNSALHQFLARHTQGDVVAGVRRILMG